VTDGDAKTPVEQAVDHAVELFVYAPIGLVFEGATLLPLLVEKGRSQVTMARMIGKFAVDQGRTEATRAASKLQDQAAGVLDFIGDSVVGAPVTPTPPPSAPPPASTAPTAAPTPSAARPSSGSKGPAAGGLAIPDYDGLSASQVVNRLAGLSAEELAAVQDYEAANRGRKTILSKVAQLQGS
jgi:pyruvate/2-oxoglutarate dehydrogenase complex dihydrolipoamide acyltransferase (E2) component